MSYRVEYSWDRKPGAAPVRNGVRPVLLGLFFFGLFLFSVSTWWQPGREVLLQLLFPGDQGAVAAAFYDMTSQLDQGVPVLDAAQNVCIGLLNGIY